jgi:hypothetical protein
MNDLQAPVVPGLSDGRLLSRERHLVHEIGASRRRRRQRRGFVLGGAGLAASGVITALVILLGAGTAPAFAAWTASPTTPIRGQIATAENACAARPANPPPGLPALPTGLTLADIRGPFALLLFGTNTSAQGALLCMSGPDGTQFSIAEGTQPALPGAGHITLDRLQAGSAGGQPYTIAEGSAGPGVSAVTLTLGDGSDVVTTVGNGLFLAWWPGSATVTSATLTTPSGTTRQPINSPARDTGGSSSISGTATSVGNGNAPHTAAQRAELRRYCAQLKAEGMHGPNGQPIGPCAMLGR